MGKIEKKYNKYAGVEALQSNFNIKLSNVWY